MPSCMSAGIKKWHCHATSLSLSPGRLASIHYESTRCHKGRSIRAKKKNCTLIFIRCRGPAKHITLTKLSQKFRLHRAEIYSSETNGVYPNFWSNAGKI